MKLYDDEGRECTGCKEYKTWDNFHKDKSHGSGYAKRCKPCRIITGMKGWKKKPEESRRFQVCKQHAKAKGAKFELEVSDFINPECCPVLGTPFIKYDVNYCASIDRKVPELGYIKGNIQIISNLANKMKTNATLEDLRLLVKFLDQQQLTDLRKSNWYE